MANFLAKSKGGPSISLAGHRGAAESTDFDRMFKPFALRKGVEVAPTNFFVAPREGVVENPIAIVDGETLPPPPPPVSGSPPLSLRGAINVPVHFTGPLISTARSPSGRNILTPKHESSRASGAKFE
jgi:hypothetical protein